MLSERDLIALVARGRAGAPVRKGDLGIGDDCAVLREGGKRLLVTTDLLVEGVHFDRRYSPPYLLGRKAVAVSLSDLAAMGGTPRALFVSVALPRRTTASFARELIEGFHEEAAAARAPVMGGDTSASPGPIVLDVIAVGEAHARGPLLRRGAKPGDGIYVSGPLGASALGLDLLRRGFRPWSWRLWQRDLIGGGRREERARAALLATLAHLLPRPRLALGRLLAGRGLASAMIDLSDGLSPDLHTLCEASGVGARIEQEKLPLHPALSIAPRRALRYALSGGEDYELLFTVRRRLERSLESALRRGRHTVLRIGRIAPRRSGLVLARRTGGDRPLTRAGYEHFRTL